jgi:hypothetical protein
MVEQMTDLKAQLVRGEQIVVVEEGNEFSLCDRESGIAGGRETLIRLAQVTKREGAGDLGCLIL